MTSNFRDTSPLRTVPTIVTAHTFCASGDTRVSYEWCLLLQGYFFACFKTMRRKQNLASDFGIQKEIGGNHVFFRDNKASIWKKAPYIALYFAAF